MDVEKIPCNNPCEPSRFMLHELTRREALHWCKKCYVTCDFYNGFMLLLEGRIV